MIFNPEARSWDDFSAGQFAELEFSIALEDMDNFRQLSGDTNPLHADDAFARKLGFSSRVVFGALIVAKISALIGVRLPGSGGVWAGLKIDFRNPLYIGETVTLKATIDRKSDSAKMLVLKLRADTADRCIATGTVEAVFPGDD